nr:hypothetical protein [Tanacetum cinerariifolium]
MRTKPGLDTLSFDDLYNNLRVFEHDVKGTTASSSSNTQNVAFVSVDNISNTNDVSTAYSASSPSVSKSHQEGSSSYTDEVIHSFFANQSSAPQLDCDDLEQINDDDLDEMDLKWKGILLETAKLKGIKTAEEEMLERIDWSRLVEEDTQNYAMMAYSSSNSGSDNEVKSCSKTCAEYYARLKKLYDEQRDKLGDASVEITAYTLALKKTSVDESGSKPSEYASSKSDFSVKTTTSMPAPVDNAPKIVCESKVWTDAPIIGEYESDSDYDLVSNVQENIEKPNFAFTDFVKHVKSPRENIKEKGTLNHIPKNEKHDRY